LSFARLYWSSIVMISSWFPRRGGSLRFSNSGLVGFNSHLFLKKLLKYNESFHMRKNKS
jgi:hypothetical protein